MKNITVDIESNINTPPSYDLLKKWFLLTIDFIEVSSSNIEILIVNEQKGKYYNSVFRARLGATNVLSFPDDQNGGLIILCDPIITQESIDLHISKEARYFQVFVHGILHLCGFTHDFDEDAVKMENIEIKLFEIFKKNKP